MRFEIAVLRTDGFNYRVGILDTRRDLFAMFEGVDGNFGEKSDTYDDLTPIVSRMNNNSSDRNFYTWSKIIADDDIFIVDSARQYSGDDPITVKTVEGIPVSVRPSEIFEVLDI